MTSLWRISSSALCALSLLGSSVTGRVELRDSRDPMVRKKTDYSGVVVSLEPAAGPPLNLPKRRARMLQKNKTFVPHVLAVTVNTTVDFPNLDPIFHNAFSNYNGQLFDVGLYPPGSSRSVPFSRKGVVRVFCNIHSTMSAVLVVLDTPYFATSRSDGTFEIPEVPPGDYKLVVFHERATEATLAACSRRINVPDQPLALPLLTISESGFLPVPHQNKFGRDYPAAPDDATVYPGVRK